MADLTSIANLLTTILARPGLVDSTFQNREVFRVAPAGLERAPDGGGVTYRWGVISAANASGGVASANNGPFPAAGQNTYLQASLSPQLYDAAFQVTDEMEASLAHGGTPVDVLAVELDKTIGRVYQNIATDVVSATAPFGCELAVDSAGTYAAIGHGTTGWGSRETAVGGALTAAVLYNDEEALSLPDRCGPDGTMPDFSLVSQEQWGNLNQLTGAGTTTTIFRRNLDPGEVQRANIGLGEREPIPFSNQMVMPLRGMTNTIWLMGRRGEIRSFYWDRPGATQGMKVHNPDPQGYGRRIIMSWYGIPWMWEDPFHWAKDTGVTA